jgi:hypothetical protein
MSDETAEPDVILSDFLYFTDQAIVRVGAAGP